MNESIIVGIDIGTTKICTLVATVDGKKNLKIIGVGIENSRGIEKGSVVDIESASEAIALSIDKAEHTSGLEISSATVSLAGSHISSVNSRGVTPISKQVVDEIDMTKAVDNARAIAIPHNREVIHVIQRGYSVDGQDGIINPLGMHGYRLEVETHIITAAGSTVDNLRKVVGNSGVDIDEFVLNPLASAEVVLTDTEREMGVAVCDIGGGTTNLAIFIDGDIWHTAVQAIGGNNITKDITHGMHLPFRKAEEIKRDHGHCLTREINADETFPVISFGEEQPFSVNRRDLAIIVEARVEEIFQHLLLEIKRSGYDGLLPAGVVLTGGVSLLPGITDLAQEVLGLQVRLGGPQLKSEVVKDLNSPLFSTSVGLLYWMVQMNEYHPRMAHAVKRTANQAERIWSKINSAIKRFLP
jgi:cell division protein FtsA